MKTELNEYKNDSKKRQKSSGSEALDRQTVDKKSFTDRICDDLSEVLLQFLSFEDKTRLECVSKQFQRTAFKRQSELYINIGNPENYKYFVKDNKKYLRIRRNYYDIKNKSIDSFKAVLNKCPNITSIQLDGYQYDFNEAFRLIVENCNNLNEINVRSDIIYRLFEEFRQKFKQKIKNLCNYRDLNDLKLFPNIEKVQITDVEDLEDESTISKLKLAQLKQLDINIDWGK